MKEFENIDNFPSVLRTVKEYCAKHKIALPKFKFNGRVNLHGTQVGIRYTRDVSKGVFIISAQSKKRELTVENDNFGFAAWVKKNGAELHRFFDSVIGDGDITIFGEWVGDNIQYGVALTEAPKHFVMYAAFDHARDYYLKINWNGSMGLKKVQETINKYNRMGLFFIQQIPEYYVDVDFSNPEEALEEMQHITDKVVEDCPWGRHIWGVNGPGKGVLWYNSFVPAATQFWFKTESQRNESAEELKLMVTEEILPLSVMEIGLRALDEKGIDSTDNKNIGHFIKWCAQQARKNEDIIETMGFEWRNLTAQVAQRARRHYQTQVG